MGYKIDRKKWPKGAPFSGASSSSSSCLPGRSFKRKARYSVHRRQECLGGCSERGSRWHDSIEEAGYCDQLMFLKKGGEIRSYRPQVVYYLSDREGRACGYMKVDFEVVRADGKKEIHEYKGKLFGTLMEYRTKKALFSWCYPKIQHITVGKNQIVL